MDTILKKIQSLNGVHEVCIFHNGEAVASTLTDHSHGLTAVFQMIEQIFAALEMIGKDHNELYFTFAERQIAAYLLSGYCVVLLITDKKINYPLINMGVKAATSKIQEMLAAPVTSTPPSAATLAAPAAEPVPTTPPPTMQPAPPTQPHTLDAQTSAMLRELASLLTGYFGPAARIIFEDAQELWEQKHAPSRYTAGHLLNLLLEEFDSDAEKLDFQQKARQIIKS